jgi:hypothetical protein
MSRLPSALIRAAPMMAFDASKNRNLPSACKRASGILKNPVLFGIGMTETPFVPKELSSVPSGFRRATLMP